VADGSCVASITNCADPYAGCPVAGFARPVLVSSALMALAALTYLIVLHVPALKPSLFFAQPVFALLLSLIVQFPMDALHQLLCFVLTLVFARQL